MKRTFCDHCGTQCDTQCFHANLEMRYPACKGSLPAQMFEGDFCSVKCLIWHIKEILHD